MIEYILGFLVLLFAGREMYHSSKKKHMKAELGETLTKLDKEKVKNVKSKVADAKAGYVNARNAYNSSKQSDGK